MVSDASRTIGIGELEYKSIQKKYRFSEDYNYSVFFSCSPKEKSYSSDRLSHGIWTWYLCQAFDNGYSNAYADGPFITITSLKNYLSNALQQHKKDFPTEIEKSQTPYTVLSTSQDYCLYQAKEDIIDFSEECKFWLSELLFHCASVDVEKCIGRNENFDSISIATARDICWDLSVQDYLYEDWEKTFDTLKYYTDRLESGKTINLPYTEQLETLQEIIAIKRNRL